MQKIRKGDQVVVTRGSEKGKRGTVLRVLESGKVLVEGVNRAKKHQRPTAAKEAKQKAAKPEKGSVQRQAAPTQPARLKVHYETNVVPALMKQFGYKTKMQVPRIEKITLNMGVGEAVADKKIMDNAVADMQ